MKAIFLTAGLAGIIVVAIATGENILNHYTNASEYPKSTSTRPRDQSLKAKALARDHIPASQGRFYEADHIIPLCLGGPDRLENIQLQPWDQANRKDEVERWVCGLVRDGKLTKEAGRQVFIDHKGAW